jgi:hypothetical protein
MFQIGTPKKCLPFSLLVSVWRKSMSSGNYSRTPLIRIDWDGEASGYAENPDNWTFLWKYSTLTVWISAVTIYIMYLRLSPGSNPGGGEIFRTCPDRPWGPPSLLYNGYRVSPGGKVRPGRDADPSPLLVPKSKNRATPLLSLRAFVAYERVKPTYLRLNLSATPDLKFWNP